MNSKSSPRPCKALFGHRILVTRSKEQSGELSLGLQELGATVIEIPSIEIRPPASFDALDTALKRLEAYQWLILTSANGVRALFSRLQEVGLGIQKLLHVNIAAIGPATRVEIEKHGIQVDAMPREYIAEAMLGALSHRVKGKRVLLVRAKVARDVIPQQLRLAGAVVEVADAYETVVAVTSSTRLREVLRDPKRRPTAITFTSSSTARNFLELLGKDNRVVLGSIPFASIGPVTSSTLRELGLRVDVEASEHTITGLIRALAEWAIVIRK